MSFARKSKIFKFSVRIASTYDYKHNIRCGNAGSHAHRNFTSAQTWSFRNRRVFLDFSYNNDILQYCPLAAALYICTWVPLSSCVSLVNSSACWARFHAKIVLFVNLPFFLSTELLWLTKSYFCRLFEVLKLPEMLEKIKVDVNSLFLD